jgi:hypothetical protein
MSIETMTVCAELAPLDSAYGSQCERKFYPRNERCGAYATMLAFWEGAEGKHSIRVCERCAKEYATPKLHHRAKELLSDLRDYFADCADVKDGPEGEQYPNDAMSWQQRIEEVIGRG